MACDGLASPRMSRRRTGQQREKRRPGTGLRPSPVRWLKLATLCLAAAGLVGLFATPIADTDFWWHLKTGQYIVEHRELPVPDPFAYSTAGTGSETRVQRFNLTHEWLSQALMYAVFAMAGFPGIIAARVLLLAAVCGLAGFLSARLSGSFYAGIAGACATASVMLEFAADRPGVVSFLGVAVFITLLEMRRGWWALPVLALVWANCHGGFVLGWVVLAAYAIQTNSRKSWLAAGCAVAVSGINPNGFSVLATMLSYRRSPMQASLIEWQPPKLWGTPYAFDLLLYASAVVLILAWRRVRLAHWILFAAFAAASLAAFRNIPLIGFLAPVLIAAYFPFRIGAAWPPPVLAAAGVVAVLAQGAMPQFRVAEWTVPAGAADYLIQHHATGPMFNTYEQGGYLIWRLWPQERVFVDGRALSETVYRDYQRILINAGSYADQVAGPREELLNRYGVQVVAMNTMDYVSGALYPLAIALANPVSTEWELVYEDAQAVVFWRRPPQGIPVLSNKLGRVLRHLDRECTAYIENSPETPLCARTLADYWRRNQVRDAAIRMLRLYLEHARRRDEQAERALAELER